MVSNKLYVKEQSGKVIFAYINYLEMRLAEVPLETPPERIGVPTGTWEAALVRVFANSEVQGKHWHRIFGCFYTFTSWMSLFSFNSWIQYPEKIPLSHSTIKSITSVYGPKLFIHIRFCLCFMNNCCLGTKLTTQTVWLMASLGSGLLCVYYF
jgi:hypothetical protein